jgi:outer membrane protein TolC
MIKSSILILIMISTQAVAAEGEVDFSSAYSTILERSLRVSNEEWAVKSADAKVFGKKAAFLPSVTGYWGQSNDLPANSPLAVSNYGELAVGVNVYRWGADTAALGGAKSDFKHEQENLANEYLGAEQEAIEDLILVVQRQREKNSVEKIVGIKSQAYQVAKQRYGRGLLPILEVEKAGIDLDNARSRLKNSEVQLNSARSSLTVLLGHAKVASDWPWRTMLVGLSNTDHLQFKVENRPDYRAAQLTVEAETERLRQSQRQMYPSLDLSFSFSDNNYNQSYLRDFDTSLTLTFNIFNQLQDYTNYRIAITTQGQAQVQLENIKRQAEAQVEMWRSQFQAQLETVRSLDHTLTISRRIMEDSLERFRNGRATVNDLSIDQNRVLETEILDTDSWAAAHTAYASLCHACGLRLAANGSCGGGFP